MTTSTHYTPTAKALHWLMALIFIAAWLIGLYSGTLPRGAEKSELIGLHKAIGSTILALVFIRLYWRLRHPAPAFPTTMSANMERAARAGHFLLYTAMFALPLSGWAWSSVAGYPVKLAGLLTLPPLLPRNEALYDSLHALHMYIAYVAGALVAGHALAAIKHHLVDRDDVLTRMLPRRS